MFIPPLNYRNPQFRHLLLNIVTDGEKVSSGNNKEAKKEEEDERQQ